MDVDHITDEIRAVIGAQSPWVEACHPVEPSEVRRFFQAVMDPSPRYWQTDAAETQRYGGPVAPPGFPVHAFRRPESDLHDPLDARGDPEFDGLSRVLRQGLPKLPLPLAGVLNGGYDYEFFSYAHVGERIRCRSTYRDIYQRNGKSGALVFVIIEDEYVADDGRPLLKSVNTMIMR